MLERVSRPTPFRKIITHDTILDLRRAIRNNNIVGCSKLYEELRHDSQAQPRLPK